MKKVKYKKVTVLGAARSGIAAASMLKKLGAIPFVSDSATEISKQDCVQKLRQENIEYEFGGHTDKIFDAEFVVLSPGISQRSEVVRSILQKDIPLYSEIEVASWFIKGGLIAVTGSNGKTTTTTLIGEMLKRKYPQAIVAGNIGSPLSGQVLDSAANSWSVVEVSSFQLETIQDFHPQQAVILNFAPNHLDRYDSYEDYLKAKWRITMNLTPQDKLIYNSADTNLSEWVAQKDAQKLAFDINGDVSRAARFDGQSLYVGGERLVDVQDMKLRGTHNYMNAMSAALAAQNADVPIDDIRAVLKEFAGVEHRLEFVMDKKGVRYINDSKATTVESLSFALQSFDTPIVLIAGGKDKGSDFTRLNDLIQKYVKDIILIGDATEKMKQAWNQIKPIQCAGSLQDAVRRAAHLADLGDVVLLSPACASFDMFEDFEDRGRQFKQIVKGL